jgi:hypothetical protein
VLLASGSLETQKPPLLTNPRWLVVGSTFRSQSATALYGDFVQADIPDRGPDNGQATGLRGEHVNLIRALPHVAKEAFDGIGGLNMSVHGGRKLIERQGLLFLFSQTSHRFGIAFAICGLEGLQLDHGLLFVRLLPNRYEFSGNLSALSSGDRIEDIALLMRPASADEAWLQTVARRRPVARRGRR